MQFWNSPLSAWAIVAILAIVLAILWFRGYKKIVKQIVLALVIQAEKALGNGTGEFKYALVVGWVYERIPAILRFLFTMKQVDEAIEWAVAEMKRRLAESEKLAAAFSAQLPS